MAILIDVRKFVARYGGPAGVVGFFRGHGYKMAQTVPHQWIARRTIPMAAWLRMCEIELKHRGVKLDLWQFLAKSKDK